MDYNNSNDDFLIYNNKCIFENEIVIISIVLFSIIILFSIYKLLKNNNINNTNNTNDIITNDIIIDENNSIIISIGEKPDTCIICFENECNIILSCHHNIICKDCLLLLLRNKKNTCPLCRNIFTNYYINN
jgi:hypothetical protein